MSLSDPTYLRLDAPPFAGTLLSIREHLCQQPGGPPDQPLVLITFHPGFLTGSYQDRDYFERLAPLLFQRAAGHYRLRLFTVNHPGYDLPADYPIDRFSLAAFSIRLQPQALQTALEWLLSERLAGEQQIVWIAYGHSMGGLALSQVPPRPLVAAMRKAGRRLQGRRILSAPAFFLHPRARSNGGGLDLLHTLKQTVGRLPFYAPIATGLYYAFAPLFYRRDARRLSIGTLEQYGGYLRLNPFLLLEQGRELVSLEPATLGGVELLADTHVLLARHDGMIDGPPTRALIEAAREEGQAVALHEVDSTHLLELDAPQAAVDVIWQVLEEVVADAS